MIQCRMTERCDQYSAAADWSQFNCRTIYDGQFLTSVMQIVVSQLLNVSVHHEELSPEGTWEVQKHGDVGIWCWSSLNRTRNLLTVKMSCYLFLLRWELVFPKCLMAVLWRFTLLPPGSTLTPEVGWPLDLWLLCSSAASVMLSQEGFGFGFPCVSNTISLWCFCHDRSISDEVVFVCFRSEPALWSWGGNLQPQPEWAAWELYGTGEGKETVARLKQNHQESSIGPPGPTVAPDQADAVSAD